MESVDTEPEVHLTEGSLPARTLKALRKLAHQPALSLQQRHRTARTERNYLAPVDAHVLSLHASRYQRLPFVGRVTT